MYSFFPTEKRLFIYAPFLIQILTLSSCALLNANQQFTDFSAHAENVFRHQNLVIDQVMLANESMSESDYKTLSHVELIMYDKCRLLNDYALRERDGLEQDLFNKKAILDSIDGCEASISKVEKLLHH